MNTLGFMASLYNTLKTVMAHSLHSYIGDLYKAINAHPGWNFLKGKNYIIHCTGNCKCNHQHDTTYMVDSNTLPAVYNYFIKRGTVITAQEMTLPTRPDYTSNFWNCKM